MAAGKLSPMMQQYMNIRNEYADCILFFRLGDFYEMFFDDAKLVSRELELTLTGKQCGMDEKAPMCGVPFHSADTYIARLVEKGHKVAICEQTEDPATAKGLVKREVIRIVTPGTVISSTMLKEKENNYIASIYARNDEIGLAFCDISTGEMSLTLLKGAGARDNLVNELVKINAKEAVLDSESEAIIDSEDMKPVTEAYFNILGEEFYRPDAVGDTVRSQFSVTALFGLGIREDSVEEYATGALLLYLMDTQKGRLDQITSISIYSMEDHMSLDKSTIKNLELTETLYEKKIQGSLLGVLDRTHTAMGSRKMKQWIKEPLNDVDGIRARHDAVEFFTENVIERNDIKESLKRVYDFERLAGKIACGSVNGRDMTALRNSCGALPDIKAILGGCGCPLLERLDMDIDSHEDVYELIDRAIVDDPPFTVKEGNIIKDGYSKELDDLKASIKDARAWITGLEAGERERTGIKNLKVGFNKVFGYYLEVTKSYYDQIPEDYIRKQTLVNCERFITPELKETERLVLNAEVKINQMEYDLFAELRQMLQGRIGAIQKTSRAVAELDVLVSFAEVSEKNRYVKPEMDDSDVISIEKGRHPVIEQMIRDGIFVSNDTYLDKDGRSLLLITGPNMSGKSTYMRQTALIVLMAQAGCFVPCDRARIGVCDRIFTRIGASDNLAQGQSTFFVEMSELAYILNTATPRSLVILDEIGRGTSTYDGLSIAWSAAEYLSRKDRRIRTLFATHYHEMTEMEEKNEGVRNLTVDVAEENGNAIFLHKIVEGSASRSYGIHVARIAGVPEELLENAGEKLRVLEKGETRGNDEGMVSATKERAEVSEQISMFDPAGSELADRVRSIDVMNTTPLQALRILEELKELT